MFEVGCLMWAGFFLTADRQGSVQLCSQGYIILFQTDSFHLIICQGLNNPQTYMLGAPSPAVALFGRW